MKKIIILVMKCNIPFFIREEEIDRETWAKGVISNYYPNIKYFSYTSSDCGKTYLKGNEIYCNSRDDYEHTAEKTYEAFKYVNENMDYDYIFRTNTNNYINIDLLNKFINNIDNNDTIWSSTIMRYPQQNLIYCLGSSIIIPKNILQNILEENNYLSNNFNIDDVWIGTMIKQYYDRKNEDYRLHIRNYGQGFMKAYDKEIYHNPLCPLNNSDYSFEFLKKYINIQTKTFLDDRYNEESKLRLLYNIFSSNSDEDIEETIRQIKDFSKNNYIVYRMSNYTLDERLYDKR